MAIAFRNYNDTSKLRRIIRHRSPFVREIESLVEFVVVVPPSKLLRPSNMLIQIMGITLTTLKCLDNFLVHSILNVGSEVQYFKL